MEFSNNQETDNYRSLFSQKILDDLSSLIPKVTFKEIMSCKTYEQIAAERMVFHIGKVLSRLDTPQELNQAMQIISILSQTSIQDLGLTSENIYQDYCKRYEKINFREFEQILEKLSGRSTFLPIQESYQGYQLTDFGSFVFEYYRKIKAEMLVLHKNEIFKDIFSFLLVFRTLMNFDAFNLVLCYSKFDGIISTYQSLSRIL